MQGLKRYINSLSAEERANTLTHLIAVIATLAVAYPFMHLASQAQACTPKYQILGTTLFLAGMLLMYSSSTIYHAVTHPVHKRRLRVLDHISIFVMIAGSYSPVCLTALGGWMGWSLFVFLWACVIAGIVGKIIALGKYPRLSLALYLIMGWTALIILWPLWQRISHAAFFWIFAEGVFYSIGAYFFHHDEEHAFYHAIWHIFIILGSVSHSIATYILLTT